MDGPGSRSIFLINVPVGVAALLAAWRLLPESRSPIARKADWPGTVLLSGGLVAGVLALIEGNDLGWISATVLGLAAATALLLTAFLIREARTPEPMLELELLRRPSFAAIAVVAFGITASLVAATTYMALYLINTLGLTPFETGLAFLPLTGASFVAAPIAARLSQRVAPAILVPGGAALIAIGMWTMTGLDVTSDWTHLLPGSIIAGVGLGVTSAVLAQAALAAVPPGRTGMATGTADTFRQIGVAAGVAGLGALFAHRAAAVVSAGLTVAGCRPSRPRNWPTRSPPARGCRWRKGCRLRCSCWWLTPRTWPAHPR